jgi:sugar phosphate isomerase/epimerase
MFAADAELIFIPLPYTEDEAIAQLAEAEAILVDSMLPFTAKMIEAMPKLKFIQAEGVAYNLIDIEAAAKAGVMVSNNRAVNAPQVAEHSVMLILAVLHRLLEGDAEVRAGRQDEAKRSFIVNGLEDIIGKKIGLVGFGAIGKELAKRLNESGRRLKDAGISLLYHNHNAELLKVSPGRCAYDILIDETDPEYVNFEFDSYWFTDGGADAAYWMKKLGSRMKLWHINDRGSRSKGSEMTPILKADSMELGTGNMNLDALKEIAVSNGIEGVVLESHRNWIDKDPLKSIALSAEWLNERF